MKKLPFICGFLMFVTVTNISCKKNNTVSSEYEVVLYNCGTSQAGNTDPSICFESLNDSRCPINANCPWQGTAVVQVSFNENNNVHQFKMGLQNYPAIGFTSDTTINGYNIVFTKLVPYPDLSKPSPLPSEIKATFMIK
jgi:hypothetical protein